MRSVISKIPLRVLGTGLAIFSCSLVSYGQSKTPALPDTIVTLGENQTPKTTPGPESIPGAPNNPSPSDPFSSADDFQFNPDATSNEQPFPTPESRQVSNQLAQIGRQNDLTGKTESASSGIIGPSDFQSRPLLQPSSVLETIPGLVATQHSGSGKANQYFLRGVNLDHGTDISLRYDGVPMNLPTHAHGQGYLDVNWIIPELIEKVEYRLGTYYADVGDFSSVGTVDLTTRRALPQNLATVTYGSFDYMRVFVGNSQKVGDEGDLLIAFETVQDNGPWDVPEKLDKFNGVIKWTQADEDSGVSVEALAYRSQWTATNQIAARAVDQGIVSRFGSLDPTDAGDTNRVTLNGQFWQETDTTITKGNAYVAYYDLNLYSNFTFFLDDPIRGDQIQQQDNRVYTGVNLSRERLNELGSNTVGFQFRNDTIYNVALSRTDDRQFVSAVTNNDVDQQSYAVYGINKMQLAPLARSELGLRGDLYQFHSEDLLTGTNTGTTNAGILNPKTSLIMGPWAGTELFLNWGLSFHSNDARGVNAAVDAAAPLVRSDGSEIGMRSKVTDQWTTTMTLWYLEIDSELVFVGDAGTTEPSSASHRGGFNWNNFVQVNDYTTLDLDYAYVRPRLQGDQRIPNAVENVLSAGVTAGNFQKGFYGTLRLQSYGPAALIEDNSARSTVTTLVNAQVGHSWDHLRLSMDVFNLLDARTNSITYFYESRPPGLTAANDFHFHPVTPFALRFNAVLLY